MKKTGILNSYLSRIIAEMGHTDRIVIADSGLPIPPGVERIDLALTEGVPSLMQTFEAVLRELKVEKAIYAAEMKRFSPDLYSQMVQQLPDAELIEISHEQFKEEIRNVKAVVRTGEWTPYANVMLQSGVVF